MGNKVVVVLLVIVLVLSLLIAGAVGFLWYRDNHVFVEGKAYTPSRPPAWICGKRAFPSATMMRCKVRCRSAASCGTCPSRAARFPAMPRA